MNLKEFTNNPRSDEARAFAKEVQDFFANCYVIVGIKYIFTPVRGKYHLYIWNEYMNIGMYWQQFDGDDVLENFKLFGDKIEPKHDMDKCNYFQWAKLMHEDRPDWQEKYPEWMAKYRLYKLEKLFEK